MAGGDDWAKTNEHSRKTLKELTTTKPMTVKQHKAIQEKKVAARRSIEDRLMEQEERNGRFK
jgi:hypothetical protein